MTDQDVADLCAAFQAAVGDIVVDRVRARHRPRRGALRPQALRAGRRRRRRRQQALCARSGRGRKDAASRSPCRRRALCTDNAAMIAWAGAERLALGMIDGLDFAASARWPLDPDAAAAIGAGVKA